MPLRAVKPYRETLIKYCDSGTGLASDCRVNLRLVSTQLCRINQTAQNLWNRLY